MYSRGFIFVLVFYIQVQGNKNAGELKLEEFKQIGKYVIEHWVSVSVLVLLVYLILTGQIKKVINVRKLKAGMQGVEIENQDLSLPKLEAGCCPSPKCNEGIQGALRKLFARTENIQKTHEERQKETLAYREKIISTVSELEKKLGDVASTLIDVQENVNENSYSILKSNFYNKNLPAAERLTDGLRYLSKGRNGDVKCDVIAFVLDDKEDMYFTIISVVPKLRNEDVNMAIADKRKQNGI